MTAPPFEATFATTRSTLLPGLDGPSGAPGALFRRLLETSPDAVIVVDATGRILFANQQAETLFEYPVNELLGKNVDVLVPERLRGGHALHRHRYAVSPRLRPMGSGLTLFGQRRGGAEFPVEISLSPVDIDGQTLFSANIRDISERRRNEGELRRLQAQLLSAVESIQGAFALFDATDRLVICNSAYRQIVARQLPGEIVGRDFRELLESSIASGSFDLSDVSPADLARRWAAHHASPVGVLDVKTANGQNLRIIERRTAD
ncbi:MAG TPA: PAS domain S-box protein, partial [Polyangiaceae bacterium]|nr:PAS domain S-box protein [Polyangiaceae bacterium]